MSDTQATTTPALTYTVLPLPEFPTCISDSHDRPDEPATKVVEDEHLTRWYVCEVHDPTGHELGASCPACPDRETWNEVHCYGCGAPDQWHPRHEGCFQ